MTKVAGLLMGGFNAGIGFVAGTWISGQSLADVLSTTEGKWGAGIAIGMGAALGWGGVYVQEKDWFGGATLDAALELAGSVGGATALEVYEASERVRELFGNYAERLNGPE